MQIIPHVENEPPRTDKPRDFMKWKRDLIAQRNELLAALEKAERVLSLSATHVDPTTGEAVSPVMRAVRAAIAKARSQP